MYMWLFMSDSLRPMDYCPPGTLYPWGFCRQEYWNGLPCPPPGDLPNPGIEPRSTPLQVDSLPSELLGKPQLFIQSLTCFLTHIQVSQETSKVVWYFYLFKNFPLFVVIHTVQGFGVVSKAEVDVFLELSCFLMI